MWPLRLILALAACLMVSGCFVTSRVERQVNFDRDFSNASFSFRTFEGQEKSETWNHYANSIARRLEALGYRRVDDPSEADMLVFFDTATSAPNVTEQETVHIRPAEEFEANDDIELGMLGYVGERNMKITDRYTTTYRYYDKGLGIFILDPTRLGDDRELLVLFSGRAANYGRASNVASVAECLLDAIFADFYESGEATYEKDPGACGA